MCFLTNYLVTSLVLYTFTNGVPHVTEEEITSFGIRCDNSFYSCKSTRHTSRNCKCDRYCPYYGDCCFDSQHRAKMNRTIRIAQCEVNTYVINKCPQMWDDGILKYYCETYTNVTEILSTSAVLSMRTGMSYRNYYCATCNRDTENLHLWPIEVKCNSSDLEDVSLGDLKYNRDLSTWGVWYKNKKRQIRFVTCHIRSVPKFENNNSRKCILAIDTCARDWNEGLVIDKCESYQDIIYVGLPPLPYRNPHCALCNRVNMRDAECSILGTRTSIESANFVKIFDFNIPEKEGSRCQKGHVYNPVEEKCQNLTCLSFQEIEGEKCVSKS